MELSLLINMKMQIIVGIFILIGRENVMHENKKFYNLGARLSSSSTSCCWFILQFLITKTCLYNFDPLKPHFYIVKLGFTGAYIIFLISAKKKHRFWVLVRTASSSHISRHSYGFQQIVVLVCSNLGHA